MSESPLISLRRVELHTHGFVELLDLMGTDRSIAEAAWVSTDADYEGKPYRKLVRRLLRDSHTSPFEQVELKFRIKAPLFIARQWTRHRTGTYSHWNEQSGRYTEFKPEFYIQDTFFKASETNKQSSDLKRPIDPDTRAYWEASLKEFYDSTYQLYKAMLEDGISREDARTILPISLYTTWIWKIDLHNLFHFLNLRLRPDAQYQIQEYAKVIYTFLQEYFPIATEAFDEYILNARKISAVQLSHLNETYSIEVDTF